MDGVKTAYSIAYNRMLVLAKSGRIGEIVSVDATCTSLLDFAKFDITKCWNSISAWGPTAMLPIFQLLGTKYDSCSIVSKMHSESDNFDLFTKIAFEYPTAVASLKVAQGVKSEGELVISGTKGYIYIPAPWWKTDYFELRYENPAENKRYFYQLEGEGIRNEIVSFVKAIQGIEFSYIGKDVSKEIVHLTERFKNNRHRL